MRRGRWQVALAAPVLALAAALTGAGSAWADPAADATAPVSPVNVVEAPADPAPVRPGRLVIPAIGLDSGVIPVGTVMEPAPFLGGQSVQSFGVPPDGNSVGWWADGPRVGGPPMAVMLGHTYVGNAFAVFNRLVEVHPGDEVSVADEAGVTRVNFRITHIVSGIPKGRPDALQQVLSANAQNSQLALITCGGEFNREYRASADNIIAFASLA